MSDCLFCNFVSGETPTDIVFEDELVIAFNDINPKAPIHILVVPKIHTPNASSLAADSPKTLARIASVAQNLANKLSNGDYRLVFNTGRSAGQTIFHVHAHMMSGFTGRADF